MYQISRYPSTSDFSNSVSFDLYWLNTSAIVTVYCSTVLDLRLMFIVLRGNWLLGTYHFLCIQCSFVRRKKASSDWMDEWHCVVPTKWLPVYSVQFTVSYLLEREEDYCLCDLFEGWGRRWSYVVWFPRPAWSEADDHNSWRTWSGLSPHCRCSPD